MGRAEAPDWLCQPAAESRADGAMGPGGRVRMLGNGFVYGCLGLDSRTRRHALSIVVSAAEQPLRVCSANADRTASVIVVRPMVGKQVWAAGVPFMLIDLEPNHPAFRSFRDMPDEGGLLALGETSAPAAMLRRLAADFVAGRLTGHRLDLAVEAAVTAVAAGWPAPPPPDPRVVEAMTLVDEQPGLSLDALAARYGLSAHRMSQLFSREMGVPIRRYVLSGKIRLAASCFGSGRSLTEVAQIAGFVDSAHFCKVWRQTYGVAPSLHFPIGRTQVDKQAQSDWALWHQQHRAAGAGPLPDALRQHWPLPRWDRPAR